MSIMIKHSQTKNTVKEVNLWDPWIHCETDQGQESINNCCYVPFHWL